MNVPRKLQPSFGIKELRYSLKTGYRGQAKHKARFIASQVYVLFTYLRSDQNILSKVMKDQIF